MIFLYYIGTQKLFFTFIEKKKKKYIYISFDTTIEDQLFKCIYENYLRLRSPKRRSKFKKISKISMYKLIVATI